MLLVLGSWCKAYGEAKPFIPQDEAHRLQWTLSGDGSVPAEYVWDEAKDGWRRVS